MEKLKEKLSLKVSCCDCFGIVNQLPINLWGDETLLQNNGHLIPNSIELNFPQRKLECVEKENCAERRKISK
jgi:hypothetical protein